MGPHTGSAMQRRWAGTGTVVVAMAVGMLACAPPAPSPADAPPAMATWGGDLTPVVSVKELMRDVIDPMSDFIFLSVGTVVSREGIREWKPTTEEEWAKVRQGAVAMAEVSYLLKVPRLLAPEGDLNESEGPDAPEISPAEIKAKIERDPVLWQAKIEALRNVGRAVMEIVERRDAGALEQANEDLDRACESCHMEFWYPGQKELFRKMRDRERLQQAE